MRPETTRPPTRAIAPSRPPERAAAPLGLVVALPDAAEPDADAVLLPEADALAEAEPEAGAVAEPEGADAEPDAETDALSEADAEPEAAAEGRRDVSSCSARMKRRQIAGGGDLRAKESETYPRTTEQWRRKRGERG